MQLTATKALTAMALLVALAACDVATSMHGGSAAAQTAQQSQATGQQQRFSIDTPLGELASNAQAKAVIDRHLPGMTDGPHGAMAASYSLRQIQAQMPNMLSQAQLTQINAELAAIQ